MNSRARLYLHPKRHAALHNLFARDVLGLDVGHILLMSPDTDWFVI